MGLNRFCPYAPHIVANENMQAYTYTDICMHMFLDVCKRDWCRKSPYTIYDPRGRVWRFTVKTM